MRRWPQPSGRRVAAVGVGAAGIILAAACSAIVEHADAQCATAADCARFPHTLCVQGGCVAFVLPEAAVEDAALPANAPCTSTQDCLAEHGGRDWICRRKDSSCVSLLSQDCPSVAGEPTSDDAVILGALLPLYGPHASTGAALADGIRLAVNDFVGGLPAVGDAGLPRPLAVVLCDESDDVDRAALHLRDDLGLPAVLGTGEGATTLGVVHDVTFPGGQVVMSPRATVDLSSYFGSGFVWRTVPSYALEAAALAQLVQTNVVPALAARYSLPSVSVALVHATDVESTELVAQIGGALEVSADAGAVGTVTEIDFGNPDDPNVDPSAKYTDAINAVTQPSALPDVVVMLGSTQAVANVLGGIEANWPPSSARRPQYVLSSGMQTAELLALIAAKPAVRTRILGTAAGSDSATYRDLSKFLVRFRQTFTDAGTLPETFGVAQAYDAVYALAYAASLTRNTDLNGADIRGVLQRMLSADGGPPTTIDVGPDQIGAGFGALAAGKSIALRGASAPLAFDPQTGDIVTDVQVWCVLAGQAGVPFVFQSSGLAYSASTGSLQGSILTACEN